MNNSKLAELNTISKIDLDQFYKTHLENLHLDQSKRYKLLQANGVLNTTIEEEVKNKFKELEKNYFEEVLLDGWIESHRDPFAYYVV